MEKLMLIGMLLIIIGIIFIVVSGISMILKGVNNNKVEFAAGGFIGPIPFGFFTSKQAFLLWIIILIIGIIFWLLARKII